MGRLDDVGCSLRSGLFAGRLWCPLLVHTSVKRGFDSSPGCCVDYLVNVYIKCFEDKGCIDLLSSPWSPLVKGLQGSLEGRGKGRRGLVATESWTRFLDGA